jgi:hypothetical protein
LGTLAFAGAHEHASGAVAGGGVPVRTVGALSGRRLGARAKLCEAVCGARETRRTAGWE